MKVKEKVPEQRPSTASCVEPVAQSPPLHREADLNTAPLLPVLLSSSQTEVSGYLASKIFK